MRKSAQKELMLTQGYMAASDAAFRIGVHVSTIYRQITIGHLTGMRVARHWYVSLESLVRFLGKDAARTFGLISSAKVA